MLLLGLSSLVYADFYVIPVPISKKIKNVITVAKSGGQFTDVKAALDSITDANATNPYLIYIAPGNYTVTDTAIQMKPFVTIMGSGEKATVLEGSNGLSSIIKGVDNATLVNLAVVNNKGSDPTYGIYNESSSPIIKDVTVTVSNGYSNYAVYNNASSPTMTSVTTTASGGSTNYGVYNNSSSPIMINVSTKASAGGENYGVYNEKSSPTMSNVIATASGGNSYGVYNNSSSPIMTNVAATASAEGDSYGVYNDSSSSPMIRNCILKGTTKGIYGGSASLSTIIGGNNDTSSTCTYCVKADGTETGPHCN